jgi:hypothetical protein
MFKNLRRSILALAVVAGSTVAVPVAQQASATGVVASSAVAANVNPGIGAQTVPTWSNTNVISVSAGFGGTCAIQGTSSIATSGTVFCWGKGALLGAGSTTESNVAVAVPADGLFTNTAVTAVTVGDEHACAIEGGKLWCWGGGSGGSFGVIGNGTNGYTRFGPTLVSANAGFDNDGAAGDEVTAVSTSFANACAIEGGEVFCWGNNNNNQLTDMDIARPRLSLRAQDPNVSLQNKVQFSQRKSFSPPHNGNSLVKFDQEASRSHDNSSTRIEIVSVESDRSSQVNNGSRNDHSMMSIRTVDIPPPPRCVHVCV